MKLPPSLLYIKIKNDENAGFGIWLPLFLLWPPIILILVPAFLITALADLVMLAIPNSYHSYTKLLFEILLLTFELRDLRVNVNDSGKTTSIKFI